MYTSSIGLVPDVVGITKVYLASGVNGTTIEVAAGLAVQGEYAGPWDHLLSYAAHKEWESSESGFGMAQTKYEEMDKFKINGSVTDSQVAIQVMQKRIQEAQNVCEGCDNFNLLVAAGVGQNGYIDPFMMAEGPSNNWSSILNIIAGDEQSQFRVFIDPSDKKYNALVLQKFAKDLNALHWLGWDLPEGMTEDEFNKYLLRMESLANGK